MAFSKDDIAHLIVRICWTLSFILLWVGLFAKGWYATKFEGKADSETPAFRLDYEAHYGLFGIQFDTPSGANVVDYNGWARVTSKYPEPYLRVHGSRVSAVIAAIACILTALSYYRTSISKAETQLFSTARMAWLGALDLALTLTTLGLWAILNGDAAFNTVCEKSGCFPVPGEQMATSTISYSWAIWFVRAVLQCAVVGAACYLARARRSNVAFRTPKSAEMASGVHPSAPELEASPTMKSAV